MWVNYNAGGLRVQLGGLRRCQLGGLRFVGPVDFRSSGFAKSVLWVDFRWIINAGGLSENAGFVLYVRVGGVSEVSVRGSGGQGRARPEAQPFVGSSGLEKGKGSLGSRRGGRSKQCVRGSHHFPASQRGAVRCVRSCVWRHVVCAFAFSYNYEVGR